MRSTRKLRLTRRVEEIRAGTLANFAGVSFLDYSSEAVKDAASRRPTLALYNTLLQCVPTVGWTHSPFDKHESYRASFKRSSRPF